MSKRNKAMMEKHDLQVKESAINPSVGRSLFAVKQLKAGTMVPVKAGIASIIKVGVKVGGLWGAGGNVLQCSPDRAHISPRCWKLCSTAPVCLRADLKEARGRAVNEVTAIVTIVAFASGTAHLLALHQAAAKQSVLKAAPTFKV